MAKSRVKRIADGSAEYMKWANWSHIQVNGPIDDGRLASLVGWCRVTVSGEWAIYYTDSGKVVFGATSRKATEIANAYLAGWARAIDRLT